LNLRFIKLTIQTCFIINRYLKKQTPQKKAGLILPTILVVQKIIAKIGFH
jgi:hypothetical protein